ncbi:hypothetical protein [Mycobacterium sp. M26]|uniref:hypothetical protein n=1 Tax=Mycobacterium sp. M26 TaxID=1762962 RepID=UPI00073F5EB8|nr:hypothetical protein [Mycobacterium sp. M26]
MTTIWMKRLAAGAMLTAAPALFAIGAAGVGNAAPSSTQDNGPHLSEPAQHESFPHEDFLKGVPGTPGRHNWGHHHAG